jgi:hypothetical protein
MINMNAEYRSSSRFLKSSEAFSTVVIPNRFSNQTIESAMQLTFEGKTVVYDKDSFEKMLNG